LCLDLLDYPRFVCIFVERQVWVLIGRTLRAKCSSRRLIKS